MPGDLRDLRTLVDDLLREDLLYCDETMGGVRSDCDCRCCRWAREAHVLLARASPAPESVGPTPPRCDATPNPGSTLRCDRPAGHDGNHSAWTRGEHGVYGHTNWEPAQVAKVRALLDAEPPLCPECNDAGWKVPADARLAHMREPCPFCAKGYEIEQAERRAARGGDTP